jgi:phenylacetate-CoA ligase
MTIQNPKSKIQNEKDVAVRAIVAYGYDHSPAFRRRIEAAGLRPADVQSVAELSRLPVLRKENLAELQRAGPNLGGMLTVPLSQMRRVFQSPGPIYDPEPDAPDSWRWAPALRAAGIGTGDIAINCFGYHLTPAGAMFEEGARLAGCAVVPGGIGNQPQQIEAIAHLGVTAYVGLPSYLKALLEKARELGHDPRAWALKKALVTAEPLPPSLRALLLDEYGIECFNVYGTAECGNLGFEGASHNGLHLPDDALVQVCDLNSGAPVEPGVTGEVVVTLFRRDYILVRFAVGDLSALMDAPPADDLPGLRLVGWLGRSGDSVKVRGIFVHPRHADEALRTIPGVAAYQVVVSRREHRDELTARIVPVAGAEPGALTAAVGAALQGALKLRCDVALVETIPADARRFVDERTWD